MVHITSFDNVTSMRSPRNEHKCCREEAFSRRWNNLEFWRVRITVKGTTQDRESKRESEAEWAAVSVSAGPVKQKLKWWFHGAEQGLTELRGRQQEQRLLLNGSGRTGKRWLEDVDSHHFGGVVGRWKQKVERSTRCVVFHTSSAEFINLIALASGKSGNTKKW